MNQATILVRFGLWLSVSTLGVAVLPAQCTNVSQVRAWNGRSLYYYPAGVGFGDCAASELQLLTVDDGRGQCGSFARLFMAALAANGITAVSWTTISPVSEPVFLVKDWSWGTPTSGDPSYPYKLVLNPADSEIGMVFPGSSSPVYGDLTSLPTLAGQNSSPPSEKVFRRHFVVKVLNQTLFAGHGPYFDPSYGVEYADAADFETKAVAGIAVAVDPSTGQWRARKVTTGNITMVP